jgi:hypothetical protein
MARLEVAGDKGVSTTDSSLKISHPFSPGTLKGSHPDDPVPWS